jgi:hypothetical protein
MPTVRRDLIWIILLAFVVHVAVRWHSGGPDFWEHGYTFFSLSLRKASLPEMAYRSMAGSRPRFTCHCLRLHEVAELDAPSTPLVCGRHLA